MEICMEWKRHTCIKAETGWDPAVCFRVRQQISSVSVASGAFAMWFVFTLQGHWDLTKPFPRHICFCVVRRDRDGDAVIFGLDFSSTSTQLASIPFSLLLYLFIYLSLCHGERKQWTGLNVMAQDQRHRKERETKRKREVVYLALWVTLLWRLSSSHALDFLKLLHHRPSCQSWILIGWAALPWLHKLHSSTLLA